MLSTSFWITLFQLLFIPVALGLGKTDTITWGGDNSRAGYETNHNLDPAVVGSADFGRIWSASLPGNFNGIGREQIYSQPLVYTTGDGVQYVFVATTQNNIYKLDAKTGEIVAKRNLHVPFLTAELGACVDITRTIGVTGTGVIDPETGLWYLTAKTYAPQFQSGLFSPTNLPGRRNGRYYFHAISTADLSEAAGFPKLIDGTLFRNNPRRMFLGGDTHQRPGLLQVGDYIYTGWASHCIQYNYTGAIIGFHRSTGEVIEAYAMQGGPEPITVEGGGVWMSGGGLAYDGRGSMFFSTGNGYASQLPPTGRPVQGRFPPTALEQAVVNMRVGEDGKLTPVDFFMPWEKVQLDGADKDLGTTPFQLLPQETFSCPNDRRIGVVTGKSGKTYWLNLDSLGGYQMGPDRLDDAIQVTQNENSVFAGAGVLPLGGGYIYIKVTQFQTHIFKFSCNAAGRAVFTKVADTPERNANIIGTGHGTTTSLEGREGTGLLWTTDREGQNLRIYEAVPPAEGGNLKLIKSFNFPAVTKFSKPVFGDGRAYVGTTEGMLYAFGSPVSLPLNCSGPYDFNRTSIGNSSEPARISCTANVRTTLNSLVLSGNPNFNISNLPTLPLSLNSGSTFSFQAVFSPKTVGLLSSDVLANTTNAVEGFSTTTPITLRGTSNSAAGLLSISPGIVQFTMQVGNGPTSNSAIFSNNGDSVLTFTNISYSIVAEQGPWITPNVTGNGSVQVGPFTFSGVPTSIPANGRALIGITYNATEAGNHAVYIKAFSNGGDRILDVFGTAGSEPMAVVEFQSSNGTAWIPYVTGRNFSFDEVLQGTTRSLVLRITNNGSDTAAPLGLTVSKPPFGLPGIVGAVNNIDLAEGTLIPAGQSRNATLFCAVPERQVNMESYSGSTTWTFNTNDQNGKFELKFDCTAISQQVGPRLANGTTQYGYVGCFRDLTPGRQLAVSKPTGNSNTNGVCMTACQQEGWIFAGTSYRQECWCGNARPLTMDPDEECNFRCTGANNETCGGDGLFRNKAMISLFADRQKFDGDVSEAPLAIPQRSGAYAFAGCYRESGAKAFNERNTATNMMTVDACRQFCGGSTLFGLQWAQECFCGSRLASSVTLVGNDECNMSCKGNNSQYCGASSRMQVYQLNGTIPEPSSTTSSTSNTLSTSTESSTTLSTTSTGPTSTPSNVVCPENNGTIYRSNGRDFVIECGVDYIGGDLTWLTVNSFARCIDACAQNSACVDVSLSGVACYLKDRLGPRQSANVWGARLLTSSSNTTSSTTTSATTRTTSSTSSSSAPSTSAPSTTAPSTTAPSPSASSTTTSTTSSTVPNPTSLSCPSSNGTTFVSNERSFIIECFDRAGGDMKTVDATNLRQCIDACATTTNCINVAFLGAACYMKNRLGAPIYNSVQGARLLPQNATSPSSTTTSTTPTTSSTSSTSSSPVSTTTSSTSSTLSTSSTASTSTTTSSSSTLTTPSSSTSSTTSTSPSNTPTIPPSIGNYTAMGCYTSNPSGPTLNTTFTSTSMTPLLCSTTASNHNSTYFALSGTQCHHGTYLNTTSTLTSSSNCTTPCPTSPSHLCGGPLALLTLYRTTLSCPQDNATTWSSLSSSAEFSIQCGIDREGGSYKYLEVGKFEECLGQCAKERECRSVAMRGRNCYLKRHLGNVVRDGGIWGAEVRRR